MRARVASSDRLGGYVGLELLARQDDVQGSGDVSEPPEVIEDAGGARLDCPRHVDGAVGRVVELAERLEHLRPSLSSLDELLGDAEIDLGVGSVDLALV